MVNDSWVYRTSSYTEGEGKCVEVAGDPTLSAGHRGDIALRDTKNREGGRLRVNNRAFATLVGRIKNGQLG